MWHGYILMQKPVALSAAEWLTVLNALRAVLGKADNDPQPSHHLHWRRSLDGSKIIIEAEFDPADLDTSDLTRLCKYISDALTGKYTPIQVRTALTNNVTVWQLGEAWGKSHTDVLAYLAAHLAEWEPAVI